MSGFISVMTTPVVISQIQSETYEDTLESTELGTSSHNSTVTTCTDVQHQAQPNSSEVEIDMETPVGEQNQTSQEQPNSSDVEIDMETPIGEQHQTCQEQPNSSDIENQIDTDTAVEEQHQTSNAEINGILDIYDFDHEAPDEVKYGLIRQREPNRIFQFPSKTYSDKRRASGNINRSCVREWFSIFKFVSYSMSQDGLYCLPCRLFPDTSHRRPKKLITEPYKNWKHAKDDLKVHAITEYHQSSMAKLDAFCNTYINPSARIDAVIAPGTDAKIKTNRQILASIVKSVVFCGRQGIALRGHRDDDTEKGSSFNKGNFKELLNFRVEAGDTVLEKHLNTCAKNAKYTSKTSQNELLLCLKKFIQNTIVDEVKAQAIGPFYGIQCDEVTDSSNWEQLGIVIRYTVNNRPVERLLEFVACESISGVELANKLIESLSNAGLDTQLCRSQTMDGAGNMSGKYNGCAAKFKEHSPKAIYHYCTAHDLNLVLCKSSQVKEIHIMLDTLKQLGIFFKYSPKRCRRLEKSVADENATRGAESQITNAKFKIFCETRWVEKFTTLHVFSEMYQPMINCLEAISTEGGWDTKAVTESHGLLKRISDPTFIVCFQTTLHFYGYLRGLSKKLQGTALDIFQGYSMVDSIKDALLSARQSSEEYDDVFEKATTMAEFGNVELVIPRRCGRQTQRNNVPGDNSKTYFRRAIYLPYLDSLIQEYNSRFSSLSQKALKAMALIPAHLELTNRELVADLLRIYKDDLPLSSSFDQELNIWRRLWSSQIDKPNDISSTIADKRVCPLMFPNITRILNLLLLTSVTASSVERANSSLRFVKNCFRSTMDEDRFNALILLFIHKDIEVDIESVVDMYARKYPRRMLLFNPLADEK